MQTNFDDKENVIVSYTYVVASDRRNYGTFHSYEKAYEYLSDLERQASCLYSDEAFEIEKDYDINNEVSDILKETVRLDKIYNNSFLETKDYYFTVSKNFLEKALRKEFLDAVSATIRIECKSSDNIMDLANIKCFISPTIQEENSSNLEIYESYDWHDISLPKSFVDKLVLLTIANTLTFFDSTTDLTQWANAHGLELSLGEAALLLGYLEGHDYAVGCDSHGQLYRKDIAEEDGEIDEYSLEEIISTACEWNYELIADSEIELKETLNKNDHKNWELETQRYDKLKADESKLDDMYDRIVAVKSIINNPYNKDCDNDKTHKLSEKVHSDGAEQAPEIIRRRRAR